MITDFINYVKEKHNIDLKDIYFEYLSSRVKEERTIEDFIRYASMLFFQNYEDVIRFRGKHKRGSNNISLVQGLIVKAILEVRLPGITPSNIYKKVFNEDLKDRTMAYYWKDYELIGKDQILYNKLIEYLQKYVIIWTPIQQET